MKKTAALKDIYDADFNVKVLNSMKQNRKNNNRFSCINKPKNKNIFVFLNNCEAKYTLKNGSVLYAKSGDVVYTPIGLEYSVEFFCDKKNSFTIGINVMFFDDNNGEFSPEGNIAILHSKSVDYTAMLFQKINDCFMSSPVCYAKIKALFYEILSDVLRIVRDEKHIGRKYEIIKKGILYMESDGCLLQKSKIYEIAEMCNVSEVHFRRLFKEYSGMTPIEYIIDSKICRAKKYLKYENIGISQTAQLCGFESEAYFCRIFKKKTGMSPLKYKEKL